MDDYKVIFDRGAGRYRASRVRWAEGPAARLDGELLTELTEETAYAAASLLSDGQLEAAREATRKKNSD